MGDSLSVGRLQEENNKLPTDNQKPLPEESEKISKTRVKLERRLKKQDEGVTKENLDQKVTEIHNQIARQSEGRVYVKKTSLSLFDNNQTPAKSSTRVDSYANKILSSDTFTQSLKTVEKSLKDRIIKPQ
ncbi:MAG: hypothetical protein K1060chlam4_00982 [Candidatus Anoxychlamydiales bacterium]|nr:hypothetical protein [Candidatus Anoxychlamydiales bacterium]